YIDTGAMYRALTLKVLGEKVDIEDTVGIIEVAKSTVIDLVNNPDSSLRILLDGKDVSRDIRQPYISRFVSDIAKIKEVREVMLGLQRVLGGQRDCVLDGRDIGTVVFPEADKKFYLDANLSERTRRRHKELQDSGQDTSLSDVELDIHNRDTIDSTRKIAPLKKAEDAVCIDTTKMTISEVVDKVLEEIKK
ncbi:MAG: (d)CMP kinase, partial [Candidatus Omnitrophica bacterium]|nr:(d)CMP kinase [Candidatus Omnitrophota bacterium]